MSVIENNIYPIECIFMSSLFWLCVFEMLVCLVTPNLAFEGLSINTFNTTEMVEVDYSINAILQLFNIGKFAYQLLEVFSILKYNNPTIQRINRLFAHDPITWGSPLKNYITNDSGSFMIYSFILSMFLFSGCALILERPVAIVSGNQFTEWQQSLWFTIITMMTVGYGDIKPTSTSGKFIIMFIVVWGNFWSSIFLTTVVPFVQLSIQEEKALNLQQRLAQKKEIIGHSAKVITQLLKFNAMIGKNPSTNDIQALSTKTFVALSDLRFAQKEYNFLYNESMINYHDILAKVESEMNLTESQLRRSKTLSNVIVSIFRRLQKNVRGSIEENDLGSTQRRKVEEDESDDGSLNFSSNDFKNGSSGSDSPKTPRERRGSREKAGPSKSMDSSEQDIQNLYQNIQKEDSQTNPSDFNP